MRWPVLSVALLAIIGCFDAKPVTSPSAPAVAVPKGSKQDEQKADPSLPDNAPTREQRDYRHVLLLEDAHRVEKLGLDVSRLRDDKEETAKIQAKLREIENEHRELIIRYPQWQRPVLKP